MTIARRDQPVAHLVPVADDAEKRCRPAAQGIKERRKRLEGVAVAELADSIREGRRN